MPDTSLPASGKDTSVTLSLDGALKQVQDQVTRFTCKPMYDEIVSKSLGKSGSNIDKEFAGWEGTIEFDVSNGTVDEMFDLINAALQTRIPTLINIVDTTHYRDLSSKTYTYPDVKLDYDRRTARTEATKITVNWKTGLDRIAA